MNRILSTSAIAIFLFASSASAQLADEGRRNLVNFQPLSFIFGLYSAEYERHLGGEWTLGAGLNVWDSGSFDEDDDTGYTSGDVKLRFYPEAVPFQGFSFGMSLGFSRVSVTETNNFTESSRSGATAGISLDYSWLLGQNDKFFLGSGIGAKRIFVDQRQNEDFTRAYPTARLSVGFVF